MNMLIENSDIIVTLITKAVYRGPIIKSPHPTLKGYAFVIQEQKLSNLMHKRDSDAGKAVKCVNGCRLCGVNTENITCIISSCTKMASRYYKPKRHGVVGRALYNEISQKDNSAET